MILGAIADDLTGATDLASTLVNEGLRVALTVGMPRAEFVPHDVDAVVIALKSRSIDPAVAVELSLAADCWLRANGVRQIFFKYCSTFDSTDRGNIGPVLESLLHASRAKGTIACPAFPENGRTVYQGHLFVGSQLLSDSGMRHHPLNPMTDPNLVRLLQRQTRLRVGLIPWTRVYRDLAVALAEVQEGSPQIAIVDAITNDDLRAIASACAACPLISGGSGLGLGLPAAYRAMGWVNNQPAPAAIPNVVGLTVVLAGSCSEATRRQVEHVRLAMPHWHLEQDHTAADVVAWAEPQLRNGPLLIESSASPMELERLRESGTDSAIVGRAIEELLAEVAVQLVRRGVRRLVIAGGETSGAIVSRLGVSALRIGPSISPGVPWTESLSGPPLALALKSGNFGGEDFMTRAVEMLP